MEINNAYTGERLNVDPDSVVSLDALKAQLAASSDVDVDNMLLLVAPGASQLRLDKCVRGQVVFLYDRQLIAARSMTQSRLEYSTQLPSVPSQNDVQVVEAAIKVIDQATQLALAHMNTHLRSLAKSLRSKLDAFRAVRDDAAACANWERVWDALHRLSIDQSAIPAKPKIADAWNSLQTALATTETQLQKLDEAAAAVRARAGDLLTQMAAKPALPTFGSQDLRQWMVAKRKAQDRLCDVLREIATVQHRLGEDLRPKLAEVTSKLVEADEHKTVVAAVIDIPFLQGAVLIEQLRRSRWLAEFYAQTEAAGDRLSSMREQELERIDQWNRHYSDNALIRVLGTSLQDSVLPPSVEELSGALKKFVAPQDVGSHDALVRVDNYLNQLRAVGLSDTYTDLKFELDAMTTEMAEQLSRSSTSGLKAKYEARIRQLETTLLQVRMETTPPPAPPAESTPIPPPSPAPVSVLSSIPDAEQKDYKQLAERATKLSEKLWQNKRQVEHALNGMGLQSSMSESGDYEVNRVKGLGKNPPPEPETPESLQWAHSSTDEFDNFVQTVALDYDAIREGVSRRFGEIEKLARKLQTESKQLRERTRRAEHESRQRLALHSFRSGDLILFLPTRGQSQQGRPNGDRAPANANPWAAFNAGAPHYFLQPEQARKLSNREYLIARAATVEPQRVESGGAPESNPFGLATGTEWFLINVQGEWDV